MLGRILDFPLHDIISVQDILEVFPSACPPPRAEPAVAMLLTCLSFR